MKRILMLSISILLISMVFFSCQQVVREVATLSGTIEGFDVDSLKINYYKFDSWEGPEQLWALVDSMEKFTTTLPVKSLKSFGIMQHRVLLQPGWRTTLNMYMNEAGELDSITFHGDGAKENEVYNKNRTLIFSSYENMNKEPDEYITYLDSIDHVMNENVESLRDADQEIVSMLRNTIAYHQMDLCVTYAVGRFDRAGIERPNGLKYYMRQFDSLMVFNNPELLNSFMYTNFLLGRFDGLARDSIDYGALLEAYEGDRDKARKDYNRFTFNLMLDLADSIIPNQEVRSFIYCSAFSNALVRDIDPPLIKTLKHNYEERFQEVVSDTAIIKYIGLKIDRYEKLTTLKNGQLEGLSPGMPAPDFSYPDITGQQVRLSDLKGKYVYMDVWATWCPPCIAEIPKLKELQEAFGDEIAFISISVDKNKEKWHKYVKEKELTGIQIYAKGGTKAQIMDLYMIQAIPRFVMIAPDGNLINFDASRPSNNKTRKIFEEWTNPKVVGAELI